MLGAISTHNFFSTHNLFSVVKCSKPVSLHACLMCAEAARARHRAHKVLKAVPEARIAAVFVLYTLYYTQPSKPYSHIYVSPDHCESLKQTTLVLFPFNLALIFCSWACS